MIKYWMYAMLAALMFAQGADAATLKIATVTPEGSQWKEIRERTDGRVDIKYYGGGVMGNDAKVLGRIRIGALQGGAFTPSSLSTIYPDLNLYGLPMVFDSEDEASYVRDRMDEELESGLEAAGFVNFGFAAGGFAVVMSNTPVRSLDDLRGKRVWVPEGDQISYASMEALSLSPVTLPLTDVLTGLQTGLIDTIIAPPIGAIALQWHTKINYVMDEPLTYFSALLVIDKKAFNKLKDEDREIVRSIMSDAFKRINDQNRKDNAAAKQALMNQGIEFVRLAPDAAKEWRQVGDKAIEMLEKQNKYSDKAYGDLMKYLDESKQAQSH